MFKQKRIYFLQTFLFKNKHTKFIEQKLLTFKEISEKDELVFFYIGNIGKILHRKSTLLWGTSMHSNAGSFEC